VYNTASQISEFEACMLPTFYTTSFAT